MSCADDRVSVDEDLRAAERAGDKAKVEAIRKRLGDDDTKLLLLEFEQQISGLEQKNRDHGYAIEGNKNRIEFLRRCMKGIVGEPCPGCKGHGVLREWIDQDESRMVGCDSCGGKGFK